MDDTIEVRGLTQWSEQDPRPHHLDLALRTRGQEYRACLLTPDKDTWSIHVFNSEGRPARENGAQCLGGMEDAITHALVSVHELSERPWLFEGVTQPEMAE
jgi:hypothetical protein